MRNLMEANQKMAIAPAAITVKNAAVDVMQFLDSSKGKLRQIELLTIFTAILLFFFIIFGSYRRRCSHDVFRFICFMADKLSTYVLTYTLTLVRQTPFNDLFPHWLGYLMTILDSANSFSAFSLEDNEQWKSYSWQRAIKLFWVYWLLGLSPNPAAAMALNWLFFILALRGNDRAEAMRAASQCYLESNAKKVADYMREKHKNLAEVEQVGMKGCNYLVSGEEKRRAPFYVRAGRYILRGIRRIGPCWTTKKEAALAPGDQTPLDNEDHQLITVEKVWNCQGKLLGSEDPQNKLKDICLSFALFKLLRLRYAGYSLPQVAHKKTCNLICHELLSEPDGYKRAFRVIEVELTFLFDFFYTKYSIIFEPEVQLLDIMGLINFLLNIQSMMSFLIDHDSYYMDDQPGTMLNGLSVDVVMTIVMMILFTLAEFMQLVLMVFTEWTKVTLICEYVRRKSLQKNVLVVRIIKAICKVQLMNTWEQTLHQYSFLESYSHKPCWLSKSKMMAIYIDLTRDGQKESKPIKLPEEVKQAVFNALELNYKSKLENGQASLRLENGQASLRLENGQASLRLNNLSKKLLWACRLKTQTQVIMVWHIATSFCESQLTERSSVSHNFLVATSLSRYLAYLVAFAPQLLPDHPYVAECVFDQAIIEARHFFHGCKGMEDRVSKMKGNDSDSFACEETVMDRGAWLGNQLTTNISPKDTWTILANFWAELVLYVAPSDNAKAHVEHLSRGGEFVTHLWALLFHAGFERDPPTEPLHAGFERDPPTEPLHAGFERDPPTEPLHAGFERDPPTEPFRARIMTDPPTKPRKALRSNSL